MDIGEGTRISLTAKLDKTNPRGIHIGRDTRIAFGGTILSHDFINRKHLDVYIGNRCFIGAQAIVFPGLTIGDHCIVAAGSVVMQDVPPRSLVAGNPARITETNIKTSGWGTRLKAERRTTWSAPAAEPKSTINSTTNSTADRALPDKVLAAIQSEIPGFSSRDLDTPFERLDINSIHLITLRATLEQSLGATIDDESWISIVTPGDVVRLVSDGDPAADRDTISISAPATERRVYHLNMPQMALSGLSESWLHKEIGDIHWSLITKGLRTPSSHLRDAGGSRLYATFTRLQMTCDAPLTAFLENERVAIDTHISRYGAGMFFSDAAIQGQGKAARIRVMSSFSKYGEAGANTSLLKGQPEIPANCEIPTLAQLPKFGEEYRAGRSARLAEPIFECEYEIVPPHDINGVGLLYFAAYPMINDICAMRHAGRSIATDFSTRERDVFYFANSDPNETLIYRLHDWREWPDRIEMTASISRKSDGVLMAYVATAKGPGRS
jgi:probable biosynthetic protein (TIGR04098 family)